MGPVPQAARFGGHAGIAAAVGGQVTLVDGAQLPVMSVDGLDVANPEDLLEQLAQRMALTIEVEVELADPGPTGQDCTYLGIGRCPLQARLDA
jgi:hypothetical protein